MAKRNRPTKGVMRLVRRLVPIAITTQQEVAMMTAAEWTTWVEQWERSGLNTGEFARREGLEPKQFYAWCCKLGACSPPPAEPRLRPVRAVELSPPRTALPAPEWIKFGLPNGLLCVLPQVDAATVACMLAVAADLSAKDIATNRPAPVAQTASRHRGRS
jgi:hypothetical protein